MPKKKKALTLQKAVKEVESIIDEHLATLPADERLKRIHSFNEYVSKVCDSDEKPVKRVRMAASRLSARRGG
jgi:predicted metallo-beta-lactamase superfamily hydrolase